MAARRAVLGTLIAVLALACAEAAWRAGERLTCPRPPAGPGFDLYGVGESTAAGEPYDHSGFSLAGLVAWRLGGALDGRPLDVQTSARGGQSIFPQSAALERALRCRDLSRPGAALIYSGHNDEGRARGPSLLMRWESVLPRSRLLDAVVRLLEERVPALRTRTLDTWLFHLRRAVRACRAAGVVPVLAMPISDFRVDPGLFEPEDGSDADAATCAALAGLAARAGPRTRPYLTWRRAVCAEARGDAAGARALYQEALDSGRDVTFGRMTSMQAAALRAFAAEEGVALVDVGTAFEKRRDLFMDPHHPTLAGYLLLADGYARALGRPGPAPRAAEAVYDAFACDERCRAKADTRAGWFWLAVTVGHAAPRHRLAAARARFVSALAHDPTWFRARLGLAVTRRPDLLKDPNTLGRLASLGLFYGRGGTLNAAQRAQLKDVLGSDP